MRKKKQSNTETLPDNIKFGEPEKINDKPKGTNTYLATEQDQYYALKRAVCILEGHVEDKFSNPYLCQAIWEGYNHLNGLLKKYKESLKDVTITDKRESTGLS